MSAYETIIERYERELQHRQAIDAEIGRHFGAITAAGSAQTDEDERWYEDIWQARCLAQGKIEAYAVALHYLDREYGYSDDGEA